MKKLKKDNIVNFPTSLSAGEKEVEAILFAAAEPLDIDTIELDSTGKKIEITLKKYFCTDEYSLGDKIIMKNIF